MHIELVAKTIIVNSEGHLLVLRRHDNDTHRPGEWDLPGGQVEFGEDPSVSAAREAKEETGLTINNLLSIHVASRIHGNRQVVKTVYATSTYDGDIVLSHEHSDGKWVTLEEFEQLAIPNDYKKAAQMTIQSQFAN